MTIDICIPVYRNLKCLRTALRGLAIHLHDKTKVMVLMEVQDGTEKEAAIEAVSSQGFSYSVRVSPPDHCDMARKLNGLFAAGANDWVVVMEQDTFVRCSIDIFARSFSDNGYIACGPVDTYHYSHPNARAMPLYGQYGRLSPEPGYFHSSLILFSREAASKFENPFTIPDGFKMHGTGVLGGEPYYGLRINLGQDRSKLAFFNQSHTQYGYAADITWNGLPLATHLFYSSTKEGYRNDKFLSEAEYQWLCAEEDRFLADYNRHLDGLCDSKS
jgi:hypothetical protein